MKEKTLVKEKKNPLDNRSVNRSVKRPVKKNRLLGRGAEAVVTLEEQKNEIFVKKERVPKGYRHPMLDSELRRSRTRREAKILKKAPIAVPKVVNSDGESVIIMDYVEGETLKSFINKRPKIEPRIAVLIGQNVAKLHDAGIIHGDLTTSNMILGGGEVVFIDFGLSFMSESLEDKAVDIHLFKQALKSEHYALFDDIYNNFLKGYRSSGEATLVLERLLVVERRGRNKNKRV